LLYERLGKGGMAEVHRAEIAGREGFHRPVALKRMLPHMATNDEMVKSFVREAHLASHLHHANVAQTYELGKVDDIYFIAMELIEGRNLREILRQCDATTGPMPVAVALNLLNQLCDALDYAHNLCDETGKPLGIIHRDVSPSNVIVAEGGLVKLIDFGVAKASAAGMQTMSGTIKGKFGYMAPEYIAGSIDARADLFALGVVAHELLTNRPLFSSADDLETLQRVRKMEVHPPSQRNPQVPREVDDLVMTALARDPDRRWQHATALKNAMTTLTQRLGLTITNLQAAAWLDDAFAQTPQPRGDDPAAGSSRKTIAIRGADSSLHEEASLDQPRTVLLLPQRPRAPSGQLTPTMTGQPPVAPGPTNAPERLDLDSEYQVAIAAHERAAARPSLQMTLAGTSAPSASPRHAPPAMPPATTGLQPFAAVDRSLDPAPAGPPPATAAATPVVAPRATGGGMTVVWVLLAAVLAGTAVYFVLPLL
jgi:serine/threonine protein kinase